MMNVVTLIARRIAYEAGIAAVLMSLYACASEPLYAPVELAPESAINAEDVEQIPIQEVSERERAAQYQVRCFGPFGNERTPGSRVVVCAPPDQEGRSGR
jgi:hypothetical protein